MHPWVVTVAALVLINMTLWPLDGRTLGTAEPVGTSSSVVGRTLPFCHVAGQNWHCQADGRICRAEFGRTSKDQNPVGEIKNELYSVFNSYDSVN